MEKKVVWSKLRVMLSAEENVKSGKYLLTYFLLVSMLEFLAYVKEGIFSVIASRIWLMTAVALFVFFCCSLGKMLYTDIRNKKYLSVVGFLCMLMQHFFIQMQIPTQ